MPRAIAMPVGGKYQGLANMKMTFSLFPTRSCMGAVSSVPFMAEVIVLMECHKTLADKHIISPYT